MLRDSLHCLKYYYPVKLPFHCSLSLPHQTPLTISPVWPPAPHLPVRLLEMDCLLQLHPPYSHGKVGAVEYPRLRASVNAAHFP